MVGKKELSLQERTAKLNDLCLTLKAIDRETYRTMDKRDKHPVGTSRYHKMQDRLDVLHEQWMRTRRLIDRLKEKS